MRVVLARFLSIFGHLLVLTPLAALIAAVSQGASVPIVRSLAVALAVLGLTVVVFSLREVRSGRWTHIDAITPPERRSLNAFLAALLFFSGVALWYLSATRHLSVALMLSGVAIVAALALAPLLKISLHVCFAVFSTGLLWPDTFAFTAGIVITSAVAWSRLSLSRHTLAEVCVGAAIGAATIMAYHQWTG